MIRWPGMILLDGHLTAAPMVTHVPLSIELRGYRVVDRERDRDAVWVAPPRLAWLYRILPNDANMNLTAWRKDPSYFLAYIGAPTWRIGLRMGVRGRPIPALVVDIGQWHSYLPWGTRLYARLLGVTPIL